MTIMSTMKKLMGTGYEMINPVPVDAPDARGTHRRVPLDQPEPALAREEQIISDIRRGSLVSDAPVLHALDPTVAAASFRNRFDPETRVVPAVDYSEMNRSAVTARPANEEARRRSVLALGSPWDAPVLAAGSSMPITETPDVMLDAPDRSRRFGLLDTFVPIVRRAT